MRTNAGTYNSHVAGILVLTCKGCSLTGARRPCCAPAVRQSRTKPATIFADLAHRLLTVAADRSVSPTQAPALSQYIQRTRQSSSLTIHTRADANTDSILSAPDQAESTPQSYLAAAYVPDINGLAISPSTSISPDTTQEEDYSNETVPSANLITSSTTKPIRIPQPTYAPLALLDPNRVPSGTPLSARGDRKGHRFPFSRTPSPRGRASRGFSDSYKDAAPVHPDEVGLLKRRRRSTSSTQSLIFTMHSDQYTVRYTPTSPLSPQMPSSSHPMSPQPSKRSAHARPPPRNLHMSLPRFHPMAYPHHGQAASPTSTVPSPAIAITGVNGTQHIESPRIMRQKHREFLDNAKAASVQAASPASNKPTSPRLDPLGSPKGPVTPLALEDGGDYFTVKRAGKHSPAASPSAKIARSDVSSTREDLAKNKRKVDVYQ
ncbi:uncharacterized protein HMPREF1541_02337 [Cyphellophora europaea CBS 101466]|uniref:Uncharacterized protein n=1 Tax=Cyphellophora europaea (strain CBS 101466) TaxID=1220924 RepID=W2S5F0_CYPE1|nr:uncharacterized protein HMPREF1541_02337 [Cyphellophora europaea CBS 101466]ETN43179.1 hypothetical protein HMPREF1541_02337 [Cyphellophora europaea CBS 101466]